MMRSSIRRVVAATRRVVASSTSTPARPAARWGRRVVAASALTGAVAGTTITTATPTGPVAITNNSRERPVALAPVAPGALGTPVEKKKHWSSDFDGINATQRSLSKITSSDAAERLVAAATRELLHFARETPGVQAKLASVRVAVTHTVPHDEQAFLAKMEKEYGYDVLPILRREEWDIIITPPATPTNPAPAPTLTTFICYYQEGTQKILWRKLAVPKI